MILVTGATGSNGKELVQLFSAQGVPVRAMTRDPDRAADLTFPGVEVVRGDFDDANSLRAALAGVDKAFLVTPSSKRVEAQQKGFVKIAREAGVAHLVYLSQLNVESDSPARFLRYHAAVEEAIENSGLAYTFLRPNLFMQGLLNFAPLVQAQGAIYLAAGDAKVSIVDVRDIAEVGFKSLTESGHDNMAYDITGPEALSHAEMLAKLSTATGRDIKFVDVPPAAMRDAITQAGMPPWQVDGLLEDYKTYRDGDAEAVSPDVEQVLGKPARSFDQFARDYAAAFKAAS